MTDDVTAVSLLQTSDLGYLVTRMAYGFSRGLHTYIQGPVVIKLAPDGSLPVGD